MASTFKRAQSAMEYLMTYGWAILIAAVVIGAIYSLGLFNSSTFSPKLPPGGCKILRPQGPYTTLGVSLVGTCNNGLQPQYVVQFDGQSSSVTTRASASEFSVSLWFKTSSFTGGVNKDFLIQYWDGTNNNGFGIASRSANFETIVSVSSGTNPGDWSTAINTGTWYNIVFSWQNSGSSNSIQTLYVNGAQAYTRTISGLAPSLPNGLVSIGGASSMIFWGPAYHQGTIANVQFYNVTLSASDVQYLYKEGIGGAPIDYYNLVGWWPLNGDANDYSGNDNNAFSYNVIFNGTWNK